MIEINRTKAVKEIKEKLEERKKLISILSDLKKFEEAEQWTNYLDYLINNQNFLVKYPEFFNEERFNMVGLRGTPVVPEYDDILKSVFEKYADRENPIYLFPTRVGGEYEGPWVIGYTNLDDEEDKIKAEDFRNHFYNEKYMTLEFLNGAFNYLEYKKWYYRLLLDNSVEETYNVLKRVVECDNKAFKNELNEYNIPEERKVFLRKKL